MNTNNIVFMKKLAKLSLNYPQISNTHLISSSEVSFVELSYHISTIEDVYLFLSEYHRYASNVGLKV